MSINPFDVKTVLLAKHAQHVVLIHFPIALFTVAVAFDFAAYWTKKRMMAMAAYFNLMVAAVFTLPVVATGLAAWQWALEGQTLKGILLFHLVLGCLSAALILLCILAPLESPPPFRRCVEIPSGDRVHSGADCGSDCTSGRVSQWR